jgi:hemerythrin-like domain-containing protein
MQPSDRRAFFTTASAGLLLAACRKDEKAAAERAAAAAASASAPPPKKEEAKGEEVSATEDLMREHGVIRRVLVVYREAAARLRGKPVALPSDALQQAAKLIRTFGEDYHEKQLEEALMFPAFRKAGSPVVPTIDALVAQHQRGREITDWVVATAQKPIQSAEPLARTLESFARMYEEHAALEDTIVFPAWKKLLSPKELDEMGDRFEDIEHKVFGRDGFDDAVEQLASIEKAFAIDLGGLTAPPPPKS